MHPYTIDSGEHTTVPFYVAAFSLLIILLLQYVQNRLHVGLPFWLSLPSWGAVYGLLMAAFDRRLWRLPVLHYIGLVKTPMLWGAWRGYTASSFDEHAGQRPATVDIDQTWTNLSIRLQSERSRSESQIAGILAKGRQEVTVNYLYLNRPEPGAVGTMHMHDGAARLALSADGTTLHGDYYSGRDRSQFGVLHLTRQIVKG